MASVNKVIIIGNLGKDPEARFLPSGDSVSNFAVATTESWKDKSGEKQEHTEWHRVNAFGKLAAICNEYLKKGSAVYIEGKLRTRTWEQDGVKKYSTEVIADRMQMLGGRPEKDESPKQDKPKFQKGSIMDMEEDIPF